ncbi:Hpt domain-containing protein [Phyllobacterium leguminum]|uniref:Hpt domain-containing protein n=1 Tax=Phyllobacterium leguminum TaxID=314237 RepID=A0A318T6B7_9HYPH|nr:Hpt domain-containing protein [Phyllobacterium leguminum]PYE89961.1 Hpt domain-containing protein [Phyllobacterium leguminum]
MAVAHQSQAQVSHLQNHAIAFTKPGGEAARPSRGRPIDLVHLARQTLGDRALEAEVLSLFSRQAGSIASRIGQGMGKERGLLAHSLKGSARSIGAFRVAELAERVEADPANDNAASTLCDALTDVQQFIAAISR